MGHEVDVLIENTHGLQALEIKSGSTFASDWTDSLKKWQKLAGDESIKPSLVYGGAAYYERQDLHLWGWQDIGEIAPVIPDPAQRHPRHDPGSMTLKKPRQTPV